MHRGWAGLLAAMALVGACGGRSSKSAEATTTTTAPTTTTAAPTTTTTAKPTLDAAGLLAAIKRAGLPVAESKVYDASTDPNQQLGRPGGYTSKVNWHDSRLKASADFDTDSGGSIETFASADDAQRRYSYVDNITRGNAMVNEYHWIVGGVHFLRVSKAFTPDQANAYKAAAEAALR